MEFDRVTTNLRRSKKKKKKKIARKILLTAGFLHINRIVFVILGNTDKNSILIYIIDSLKVVLTKMIAILMISPRLLKL